MGELRIALPLIFIFSYFVYLSVSLCRSNWKRSSLLREQQQIRERVARRLAQERQEEEEIERQEYEHKCEVQKTLRMEQIMGALKFEVLPDEENQTSTSTQDDDNEMEAQELPEEDDTEVRNSSLAARIRSSEKKGNNPECVICLQPYKAGQVLCSSKTNQCHHIFHEECAVGWLQESKECPLCRINLLETAELSV